MRKLPLTTLALALVAFGTAASHAQTTYSGSGGTLTAPTAISQPITAVGVQLTNGGTAALSCPVTSFAYGVYQWGWQCAGGTITIDDVTIKQLSGSMTLSCVGGGRGVPTRCTHRFSGFAVSDSGSPVAVSVISSGASNNAPSKVTLFSVSY